jgi:branched-chain amino acid transport system ATP-binding protein
MLVFDHVTKRFGANTAIDDVSLTIRAGVITAMIGPNGAGKSTLVNIAAGSYRATSGRILLNGVELQTLPKYRIARAGLGRTYQNIRLFDGLTVLQNLEVALVPRSLPLLIAEAFWLAPRGSAEARETSHAVLARLGIEHLADRQAGSLAYGQQKLVELARPSWAAPAPCCSTSPPRVSTMVRPTSLRRISSPCVRPNSRSSLSSTT